MRVWNLIAVFASGLLAGSRAALNELLGLLPLMVSVWYCGD